jgi:hypothetical protein
MRVQRRRSALRSLTRCTVALGLALGVALVIWPGADAQDATVRRHKEEARLGGGRHRKAASIEKLCRIDSSASRAAIEDLADDADDKTAITAMQALCREDFSGARAKLKSIFEDDDRSDLARSMAIVALLQGRRRDGSSWRGIRGYVSTHAVAGSMAREAALAAAAKHWPSEVDDV